MDSELVEFCIAIERYLDGTASKGDIACLRDGISADPKLRDVFAVTIYRDEVICHALSTCSVRGDSDLDLAFDNDLEPTQEEMDALSREVMGSVIDQALAERHKHELEDEANRQLAAQQAEDARNRRYEMRRNAEPEPVKRVIVISKAIIWLGLAAVIGMAATVFVVYTPSQPPVSTPPVVDADPQATSPQAVAHVGGAVDAVWADGFTLRPGTALLPGDTVRLESGFVELLSSDGTRVTLEGPCDLRASSDRRMTLRRGRLVADANASDELFTITTPRGDVVDLGTVFAVEVDESQSTRLAVFEGLVEVHSNDSDATTALRVSEGHMAQMAQADSDPVVVAELDAVTIGAFAQTLTQAKSPAFHHRRAVLASAPVVYWRFEESRRGVVENAAGSRYPARVSGNLSFIPSPAGMAARFNPARGGPAYLVVDDPIEELVGKASYSIEVWFQADDPGPEVLTLVGLFDASPSRADSDPVPILLHLEIEGRGTVNNPDQPRFRFLNRNPPGDDGGTNVYHPCGDQREWMHVVAVKDGAQMRLYIDGALVATETDTDRPFASAPSLVIGDHPAALRRAHRSAEDIRPMWGAIDELAIYPHALTEDDIRAHAEAFQGPLGGAR